jgi:hypothetical protein
VLVSKPASILFSLSFLSLGNTYIREAHIAGLFASVAQQVVSRFFKRPVGRTGSTRWASDLRVLGLLGTIMGQRARLIKNIAPVHISIQIHGTGVPVDESKLDWDIASLASF